MTQQDTTATADDSAAGAGTEPIRVFLVDDHEIVRRGIADLLENEDDLTVVGEAGSADEALKRIPAARVQVAVLDARLPDGSGIDICREVRSADPSIRALILTSYDDDEALFAAVMAGASGYLLKEIRGTGLVQAIREVAAGRSLMDARMTEKLMIRLREGDPRERQLQALTEREKSVLLLIAEGKTNRQIGSELHLAEKTVKNYVSIILSKLGMQSRTQAAVFRANLSR